MGFFDGLKCKVGLHKGEWRQKIDGQCLFVLTCERCGAVKEKTEHDFGPPEPTGQDCRSVSRCARCGLEEVTVTHKYGPWTYESPTSCRQIRFCLDCNASELGETVHRYEDIAKDEETGAITQRCTHCGHEATRTPS